jgi:hypothetical protein
MRSLLFSFLVLAVAVLAGGDARAQQASALMQVSAQVVNTCHFGATTRCVLPGTRIVSAAPAPQAAGAAVTPAQRVVHL